MKKIRASGAFNFEKLKIPLQTSINTCLLDKLLEHYEDKIIVEYLKYGWPLGHVGTPVNNKVVKNHRGAQDILKRLKNIWKKNSGSGRL